MTLAARDWLRSHATLNMMATHRGVGLLFVVTALMFLPLEFTQLAFAVAGACAYTFLQHASEHPNWWAQAEDPKKKAAQAWPPALPGSWEADVQQLLGQITPSGQSEAALARLVEVVRATVQPLFPNADVCGFVSGELGASRAFRVAVPDIELVVSVSPEQLRALLGRQDRRLDCKQLEKAAIRAIAEALVAHCGFKFRRSAFRGEEPKLTLLAPAALARLGDAIPLDISVNAETPLYNAALMAECAQLDARSKQLILLVRRWAKDRGICHAAKGYLAPYHWSLLVIYFLQVHLKHGVLPPLKSFKSYCELAKTPPGLSRPGNLAPLDSEVPTAKLLKDFMHFYRHFDWRNEMINAISGERGRPIFEAQDAVLFLQDPFRPLCNLGSRCTEPSFQRIKEELKRGSDLCSENLGAAGLFEPWAPGADEE
eukprot:CAMPEP_0181424928 /NCGR_PEP_ID=MMETSP1110-20121109/14897_1 /TAXON_ID=174948 /ORGANISM="Symbiodinium sp., Strain CCMP421" /LENGTH=427 /DNA_ID=CAMNT_0023548101 /DNA_START=110 /DNA_END=1393 /DNA_ORIENTATION=-